MIRTSTQLASIKNVDTTFKASTLPKNGKKTPLPLISMKNVATDLGEKRTIVKLFAGEREESVLDLREKGRAWQERRANGKAMRARVPREEQASWNPPKNRPSAVDTVLQSNLGRQEEFVPLRMGRMAASPFTFLRGSAAVMAWDLAHTPSSGIPVMIAGDAHINNFGLYGTSQREVVFDLNDFDEVTVGPWEWDLKRLTASVNVAGRQYGLNRHQRCDAVMRCVSGYRVNMKRLQDLGVLDLWYQHFYPARDNLLGTVDPKAQAVVRKAVEQASKHTNATLLEKVAERHAGTWRLREDPPILTCIDRATREKIIDALNAYAGTLTPERRYMLARYHVMDVGHRVVGVGSVGTRCYLVLLFGNGDNDPLFLQVKEGIVPAHAPYLPPLSAKLSHQGCRIVVGQTELQATYDFLLGWTSVDGRPFYVRQLKNMKGSIPEALLRGESYNAHAWLCGRTLARAHARSADPAVIAGYCGNSEVLDEALTDWAEAYGDQTEADHDVFAKAIKTGRVRAIQGV
jgi:uncharacterized protein (DUF2252 family)